MEKVMATVAGTTMAILSGIFFIMGVICYVIFPTEAQIIGMTFMIIGAAFVLMTFVCLRTASKYRSQTHPLIQNGRKVSAVVLEVKENTAVSINGRHPWYVVCEAEGRTFESDYFYKNVHRFDQKEDIDVYLDDETNEFYVDLES